MLAHFKFVKEIVKNDLFKACRKAAEEYCLHALFSPHVSLIHTAQHDGSNLSTKQCAN